MNKRILHYIKKHIYQIKKIIIFKSSHISFWGKTALLWTIICMISLFFSWAWSPWVIVSSWNLQIDSFTSFSNILWRIWYFILITLWLIIFSLFSIERKEKIRYFTLIHISDYISVLIWSIFIFLLSIHSFLLVWGLQLFSSSITYWNGIILCVTWSLVMFAWSCIMKHEYRKNIKWSYINDISTTPENRLNNTQKDNMKLPF